MTKVMKIFWKRLNLEISDAYLNELLKSAKEYSGEERAVLEAFLLRHSRDIKYKIKQSMEE